VTTQEPGASETPDSESAKPDFTKRDESASRPDTADQAPDRSHTPPPDLGRAFDYDATAQASLSAQPPTVESLGGAAGTPGPGWDTYSGVGNGPGWGTTPSYPPPPEHQSDYPPPGDYPYGDHAGRQDGGPGPVYGAPDPHYPIGSPPQNSSQSAGPTPATSSYGPPPYGGSGYGPPPGYGAPAVPGYAGQPNPYGRDLEAPYGRDPYTGAPYSDKSKVTAGVLGILLGGFGAGRFYLDQPGVAVAQIAVTWLTCGIGGIWPLVDGILMLTGKVQDKNGRPLRP